VRRALIEVKLCKSKRRMGYNNIIGLRKRKREKGKPVKNNG
jgi:hypothetical protein